MNYFFKRNDTYQEFLKEYRKKLKYSKRYVCKETGISYNTLTNIEEGRTRNPRLDVLGCLADFYELSLADVFSGMAES